MLAARDIPTPYLAAGAAAVALGVLASPLRRLIFNVPVLLTVGSALLGRREGKAEAREEAAAKPAPAKRKAPARKAPAKKKAA